MDRLTFALTLLLLGMGGTLLTLWLLTLLIAAITRLFPAERAGQEPEARS